MLAACVFAVLGVAGPAPIETVGEEIELAKLSEIFWINPLNLLPLVLLVVLSLLTGVLTVMVGGSAETLAKAEPVMRAYSKQITLIGPSGQGQLAKSVNQIGRAHV